MKKFLSIILLVSFITLPSVVFGAIAFDSSSVSGGFASGATLTIAHTVVGTPTLGFACMSANSAADIVDSVTWNGVAMTRDIKQNDNSGGFSIYTYRVANPTTGNVVWNLNNAGVDRAGANTAYTGAGTTGQPDASAGQNSGGSSATSYTHTLTTVADNSWHVACLRQTVGGGLTAGTGTSIRVNDIGGATFGLAEWSVGAVTPAGSNVLTVTGSDTNTWWSGGISFSPGSAPATTQEEEPMYIDF